MELKQTPFLNIEQKQVLSPQMIQAVRILQMSRAELEEEVQGALLSNPLLEEAEGPPPDQSALEDLAAEEDREANDLADLELERDPSYFDDDPWYEKIRAPKQGEAPAFDQFVGRGWSLTEELLGQLETMALSGLLRQICRYLVEDLDGDGYFSSDREDLREGLLQEFGEDGPAFLEDGLAVVRRLEPAGVGAFDLSDCLALQIAAGEETPAEKELLTRAVRDFLPACADGDPARLARLLNVSTEKGAEVLDRIRLLVPRPGAVFDDPTPIPYVAPDVIVERHQNTLFVRLAEDGSERLTLNSTYMDMMGGARAQDPDLSAYLEDHYQKARQLIRNIQQRRRTLLSIAEAIVRIQESFFLAGSGQPGSQESAYLVPVTQQDLARDLGVHSSTVSRAIRGKYLQCSQGTFELRSFFTSRTTASGEVFGQDRALSMIRKAIGAEDPRHPLSDQKLADLLAEEGLEISRRTVAKYRSGMGIGSAARRRKK